MTPQKTTQTSHHKGSVLLSIKDVHLTLGGNHILDNVNIEVKDIIQPGTVRGQIKGLIGPSGVGKTQLLRIIAGLNDPDEGTVHIASNDQATLVPTQPGMVGVVAQNYPLFEHLSVVNNLVLAGGVSKLSRSEAKEKALGLLQRFGLHDRRNYWPSQLSGGQRQRISILQQLMVERFFLIMDEPFSGLDPSAIKEITVFINEVAHSHELNTILIISHDIRSVVTIADEIFILGRKLDQKGDLVRSAHIVETVNLLDLGLAWQDGIRQLPEFNSLVNQLEDKFSRI